MKQQETEHASMASDIADHSCKPTSPHLLENPDCGCKTVGRFRWFGSVGCLVEQDRALEKPATLRNPNNFETIGNLSGDRSNGKIVYHQRCSSSPGEGWFHKARLQLKRFGSLL